MAIRTIWHEHAHHVAGVRLVLAQVLLIRPIHLIFTGLTKIILPQHCRQQGPFGSQSAGASSMPPCREKAWHWQASAKSCCEIISQLKNTAIRTAQVQLLRMLTWQAPTHSEGCPSFHMQKCAKKDAGTLHGMHKIAHVVQFC